MKILSFASERNLRTSNVFPALCKSAMVLTFAGFGLAAGAQGADANTVAQNPSVLSSSVDVKEDASTYTIQLTIPEKDSANLDVRMEGKTLHIASGQPGGARQEQSFALPRAQKGSTLNMKRENGQVVITVPKNAHQGVAGTSVPPQVSTMQQDSFDSVRNQILSQFARMRQQMDQMMSEDSNGGSDPLQALLSGSGLMAGATPSGGLFQLQEQKDKYILSARIPEEQAKNIKIAVDNDRVLKITSEEKTSSGNGGFSTSRSSNFTQAMSLPGPVKTEQVSMDYKDGCFEITLPKA